MKASLYAIRSRNNGHVKKVKLSGLKQNNRDLLHKIRQKRLTMVSNGERKFQRQAYLRQPAKLLWL